MIVGNLVQGNRLAAAYGRDIGGLEEDDGGGRRYQVGWRKKRQIWKFRAGNSTEILPLG